MNINIVYSVVIAVYNRPDEITELLDSLSIQTTKNFEVIIVEDGSSEKCEFVVSSYQNMMPITYQYKRNSGPGDSRNKGASLAKGEFILFFDSDCILPDTYFEILTDELLSAKLDAFGGPDRALASFSIMQRAINYSMTSFFTTGGIRGGKHRVTRFYPRSFNMGVRTEIFNKLGGFPSIWPGEDVALSMEVIKNGYSTRLITNAFVYHKRRISLSKFLRQVYYFGVARVNLFLRYPETLKFTHWLPSFFTIGFITSIVLAVIGHPLFIVPIILYLILVLIDSLIKCGPLISVIAVITSFFQLFGYGIGFIHAYITTVVMRKPEFDAIRKR